MTLEELLQAVDETVVGPAEIAALREQLAEAERQFSEEEKRRRVTPEWLNRVYTL